MNFVRKIKNKNQISIINDSGQRHLDVQPDWF